MAGSYKVSVKDGDSVYDFVDGKYEYKTIDFVAKFDTLSEALAEFLAWSDDPDATNNVRLIYIPNKSKKGKKN